MFDGRKNNFVFDPILCPSQLSSPRRKLYINIEKSNEKDTDCDISKLCWLLRKRNAERY